MDLGFFEASLPVADIPRTMAFYQGLGFAHVEGSAEVNVATVQRGDCRLSLYRGHLDPNRLQLIFWQGDVAAIAADLTARGVTFLTPLREAPDGGASFMIADPDGHPIFFIFMPTFFADRPEHARPALEREHTAVAEADMALGWFELSLDVADLSASVGFYGQLGFEVVDGSLQERYFTLANRDCRLALYQGFLDPREPQLIFWQGDVRAIAKTAAGLGAAFEPRFADGPVVTDDGHVASMLRDPDGQVIYLINIPGVTRGTAAA